MYINDTNIIFYILASIIGLGIGQFIEWMNERIIENKKVFSKDILRKYKIGKKPLSKLLGWGEVTITRYINGDIPSKLYSDEL